MTKVDTEINSKIYDLRLNEGKTFKEIGEIVNRATEVVRRKFYDEQRRRAVAFISDPKLLKKLEENKNA